MSSDWVGSDVAYCHNHTRLDSLRPGVVSYIIYILLSGAYTGSYKYFKLSLDEAYSYPVSWTLLQARDTPCSPVSYVLLAPTFAFTCAASSAWLILTLAPPTFYTSFQDRLVSFVLSPSKPSQLPLQVLISSFSERLFRTLILKFFWFDKCGSFYWNDKLLAYFFWCILNNTWNKAEEGVRTW